MNVWDTFCIGKKNGPGPLTRFREGVHGPLVHGLSFTPIKLQVMLKNAAKNLTNKKCNIHYKSTWMTNRKAATQ